MCGRWHVCYGSVLSIITVHALHVYTIHKVCPYRDGFDIFSPPFDPPLPLLLLLLLVTDSIPTRDHGNMGMEECDFETEPRHSIAGRRVSSEVIGTRREGEEEEGGMNLEMELALAAKDIQEDVLDSVQMDLKVGVVYGGSDNKSVFKKLANSDNIDKISEGVHQLEQSKVPRRDTKLPKSSGSLNPFEEEEPSPLSPLSPPTTHTSTRTRHTAPSDTGHHSHRVQSSHSEHPKSKLKVT